MLVPMAMAQRIFFWAWMSGPSVRAIMASAGVIARTAMASVATCIFR